MVWLLAFVVGCGTQPATTPADKDGATSQATDKAKETPKPKGPKYANLFKPLPDTMDSDKNPASEEKIALGRMLYYDKRLSKNHDISCNSCHQLDKFGVDGEKTSPGHKGERGDRNSPTVYNAALQLAQFWDGRSPDVEDQAKGPVLNPVEMAMPSEDYVLQVLKSMPGYVDAFKAAFPGDADPVTYDNFGLAVGAFERRLVTPAPFDAYVKGDEDALTPAQVEGLDAFIQAGCISCHMGEGLGGTMYRKLGLIVPYKTEDIGRMKVTSKAIDKNVFKVPVLRNVTKTGPYLHDGSIASLEEVVKIMGKNQLNKDLTDAQITQIVTFLDALTGEAPAELIAEPELPASGPDTPKPDPS